MSDKPQLIPVPVMPDLTKLRHHPIAADFPMASDNDFENLKASITERGFLPNEQIVLFGNPAMVLDGRNRLKAGIAAGHKFTSLDFHGTELT